jgi:heptaprenyl diphosphate synthase
MKYLKKVNCTVIAFTLILTVLFALTAYSNGNDDLIVKVVGQGLVNGTMFSNIFLFSAAGSFASGLFMLLSGTVFRRYFSMVGICVLGALSSNIVQLMLARGVIFGKSAYLIGPPFILIGTVSAIIMGIFAENFQRESEWFKIILAEVSHVRT